MSRHRCLTMRVDLEVLIAPRQEAQTSRTIRSSVASAVTSAELGPARWEDTDSGQDLVEQWRIEQHGAPLDGRPVRRFVLTVRTDDGADVLGEVPWAAIAAVCPTARDEDRRTDAGESVMPVADAFPWSGGAHIADAADDLDTRAAPEHAG